MPRFSAGTLGKGPPIRTYSECSSPSLVSLKRPGRPTTWSSPRNVKLLPTSRGLHSRGDIQDFYCLFLASGAGHCHSAAVPMPNEPQTRMVNLVEKGIAP